MISDVDASLRALLTAEALRGTEAEVVFDAPTTEWASHLNGPVVDLFMYDIREDLQRRNAATVPEKDENGRITGRRPGSRFFRLSYLVTVWTRRPEDEPRLLGQLLENLIRFDRVPDSHLQGRAEGLVIALTTALPPGEDRSLSDVWSALGGDLKPSLDVGLVVPLVPATSFVAAPPAEHRDLRLVEKE